MPRRLRRILLCEGIFQTWACRALLISSSLIHFIILWCRWGIVGAEFAFKGFQRLSLALQVTFRIKVINLNYRLIHKILFRCGTQKNWRYLTVRFFSIFGQLIPNVIRALFYHRFHFSNFDGGLFVGKLLSSNLLDFWPKKIIRLKLDQAWLIFKGLNLLMHGAQFIDKLEFNFLVFFK